MRTVILAFAILALGSCASKPKPKAATAPDMFHGPLTAEEERVRAIQMNCENAKHPPNRVIIPYEFLGEVCYVTIGDSLICESAKERAHRLRVR